MTYSNYMSAGVGKQGIGNTSGNTTDKITIRRRLTRNTGSNLTWLDSYAIQTAIIVQFILTFAKAV